MSREKNQLLPTEKGEFLIDHIQSPELLSPKLTGDWEKKLNLMAQNDYKRYDYMRFINCANVCIYELLLSLLWVC